MKLGPFLRPLPSSPTTLPALPQLNCPLDCALHTLGLRLPLASALAHSSTLYALPPGLPSTRSLLDPVDQSPCGLDSVYITCLLCGSSRPLVSFTALRTMPDLELKPSGTCENGEVHRALLIYSIKINSTPERFLECFNVMI